MNHTDVTPETDALLDRIEKLRYALLTAIRSRPGMELWAEILDRDVQIAMDDITDRDLDSQRRVA